MVDRPCNVAPDQAFSARLESDWYKLPGAEVLRQLDCDSGQGLSGAEVRRRLARFGLNKLVEKAGRSRMEIIREQLSGVLTILLY